MKNLIYAGTLFLSLLLSACSDSADNKATEHVSAFKIPAVVQAITPPAGSSLQAFISVDGSSRQAMTIDNTAGTANITIDGLSLASHTFVIDFELVFDSDPSNPVSLARATLTQSINAGNNTLTVVDSDFDTSFDDDNDGITNVVEVDTSTGGGSTNPSNSDCVIGSSLIGSCTL